MKRDSKISEARALLERGCLYGATALGAQYALEGKAGLSLRWYQIAAREGEEWAREALMKL